MKFSALQAATAASLAALLLLSGCSLLPGIPGLGGGDSSSDGTDGDVEDNPFLDHEVPDGFPSDVPLPDLEITLSLTTTEDSWSIIYKADDLEGDFNDIVAMYEADGWEVVMNNASSDGSLGVFQKDSYNVQVLGVADADTDTEGPGISITVVRT